MLFGSAVSASRFLQSPTVVLCKFIAKLNVNQASHTAPYDGIAWRRSLCRARRVFNDPIEEFDFSLCDRQLVGRMGSAPIEHLQPEDAPTQDTEHRDKIG
jgi:hypothetical protein